MNTAESVDSQSTIEALELKPNIEGMTLWSEQKKKDFVATFASRVRAARYVLQQTARQVIHIALNRKFIGQKHASSVDQDLRNLVTVRDLNPAYDPIHGSHYDGSYGSGTYYRYTDTIGGRTTTELDQVAGERAEALLKSLPLLRDAVIVIAPDVAKKIDRVEELKKEGVPFAENLDELSASIDMDDLPGSTTIEAFKKLVEDREEERRILIKKLNKLGAEGTALEKEIAKSLYGGLPGLSDAILKLVKEHIERSKALDQTSRRVSEHVLFGDSAAATELLKRFEQDEVKIDGSVAAEFALAMENLKSAAKAGKKLLKKGRA